jgi:hypothetical protein
MKNKITNTGKPDLQSDEQPPVDKVPAPTTRDNAALMRRRRLLKGLGAAPLVITLHNGAAMAASSTVSCVGKQGFDPDPCVAGTAEDHDSFLRVTVNENGRADGYTWGEPNDKHPGYIKNQEPDRNQCLVSVDADGNIHTDRLEEENVVMTSCWTSFV